MNLLLDTQVFLWWRTDAPELTNEAKEAIADAEVVFVSVASAWEAAIKAARGELTLPGPFAVGVADSGFEELPISLAHCELAARLPPHHHDPFDRMLIAQAAEERLTLVTHDRRFASYDIRTLWT